MASKKKSNAGAPTKYKDEYCKLVVEMARQGKSMTEFRAEIGGVTRQTLSNWREAHPEFLDAYEKAHVLGEAFWEREMRTELMYSKDVNSALVKLYFANRFGWSDKTESKNENATVDKVKTFADLYGTTES